MEPLENSKRISLNQTAELIACLSTAPVIRKGAKRVEYNDSKLY